MNTDGHKKSGRQIDLQIIVHFFFLFTNDNDSLSINVNCSSYIVADVCCLLMSWLDTFIYVLRSDCELELSLWQKGAVVGVSTLFLNFLYPNAMEKIVSVTPPTYEKQIKNAKNLNSDIHFTVKEDVESRLPLLD